jgi:cobalamin biosynthesis protein CobW
VAAGRFATDPAAIEAQRLADDNLDHDSPLEELYEDQLACADIVLINKTDLLDADALERVIREVEGEVRPGVAIIRTEHGRIAPEALLGLEAAAEDDLDARPSHHDDEEEHDHDDFESFVLELGPVADPNALARRIEQAAEAHDILRVKGFAHVPGKEMRLVVQGVGRRIQHYYDRDWRPGETRATQLVVIGLTGLDRAAVHAAIGG